MYGTISRLADMIRRRRRSSNRAEARRIDEIEPAAEDLSRKLNFGGFDALDVAGIAFIKRQLGHRLGSLKAA